MALRANIETVPVAGQSRSSSQSQSSQSDPMDLEYEPPAAPPPPEAPYLIEVPYNRVAATERLCFVCNSTSQRYRVSRELREQAFLKRRLFIPKNNRVCPSHLIRNRLYEDDLMRLRVSSTSSLLDVEDVKEYMDMLATQAGASMKDKVGTSSLTDEQIQSFTGLKYHELERVAESLKSMRDVPGRSKTQALVIFLFKMRTGTSNSTIQAIFGLQSAEYVSCVVASVVESFEKDVLHDQFGISACERSELIGTQTSPFVNKLFGTDSLALIFDGTYLRHGKSSNNAYQRKSYSGQKKTHLCKPFTICTTTGYIVDMLWPSEANQNDAEIMEWAIKNTDLGNFLHSGDVCFVDRGFRNVEDFLKRRGLTVLMPVCKAPGAQLTSEEANRSRFVTKVRWAVEAVHGIIKQKYRIFDHRIDNKLLPKIPSMLRIACHLNNHFGKRLISDESMFDEVVQRMMQMKDVTNSLAEEVRVNRWNLIRRDWIDVSSDSIEDFPELSERDLKIFYTGTYQLSQSVSYLAEMLDDDGKLKLKYLREHGHPQEERRILKLQIQSRHVRAKQYRCYINYIPNSTTCAGIRGHYCECKNGARTVGCCSHVASVVYYLSHARYLSRIIRPAEILSKLFSHGAPIPVIEEDSDED